MRPSSLFFRLSLFPLLTAFLSLFTSGLSILLTYTLQSKWRRIEHIPFISDAHYDDIQSPIFSATATVTACSALATVLLVSLVSRQRQRTARLHPTSEPLAKQCIFPVRLRGRAQTWLAACGLGMGIIGAVLLTLAAAVSAKIEFHFVAISLAFAAIILWAAAVSLTLAPAPGDDEERAPARLVLSCMQLCVLLLAGAVIALVALHSTVQLAAVVLEYTVVVFTAVFLVLLAWMIRGARISCHVLDGPAQPLLTSDVSGEDSDQSIELQVLIR